MGPFSPTWRSALVAVAVLLFGLLLVWLFIPAEPGNYVPTILTPEERAWLSENPEKLTLFYNTDFPRSSLPERMDPSQAWGPMLLLRLREG